MPEPITRDEREHLLRKFAECLNKVGIEEGTMSYLIGTGDKPDDRRMRIGFYLTVIPAHYIEMEGVLVRETEKFELYEPGEFPADPGRTD